MSGGLLLGIGVGDLLTIPASHYRDLQSELFGGGLMGLVVSIAFGVIAGVDRMKREARSQN